MITLWKALIRPHIDYCSVLWAPVSQIGDMEEMEEPLCAFSKRVRGCWSLNYWERLKELGLQSNQRRNDRYRAIYMWKIRAGMVPNFGVRFKENLRLGSIIEVPTNKTGMTRYKTL